MVRLRSSSGSMKQVGNNGRLDMAKQNGWWKLETTVECEESDLEHIACLIKEGFTEGQIVHDCYEDSEDDEDDSDSCYYQDDFCSGCTWVCKTCHETYCEAHWHKTSKGHNVECIACERNRLSKSENK